MHTSPAIITTTTKQRGKKTKLHPEIFAWDRWTAHCHTIMLIWLQFDYIHHSLGIQIHTHRRRRTLLFCASVCSLALLLLLLACFGPLGKYLERRIDEKTYKTTPSETLSVSNRWMQFIVCRWIGNCGWSCWGSLIVSTEQSTHSIYLRYLHNRFVIASFLAAQQKRSKTKQWRERNGILAHTHREREVASRTVHTSETTIFFAIFILLQFKYEERTGAAAAAHNEFWPQ